MLGFEFVWNKAFRAKRGGVSWCVSRKGWVALEFSNAFQRASALLFCVNKGCKCVYNVLLLAFLCISAALLLVSSNISRPMLTSMFQQCNCQWVAAHSGCEGGEPCNFLEAKGASHATSRSEGALPASFTSLLFEKRNGDLLRSMLAS